MSHHLRIVWVEDDPDEILEIVRILTSELLQLDVEILECASALVKKLPELETNPPDAIVLDGLIPWEKERHVLPPSELRYNHFQGGRYLAGEVRKRASLQAVPIVFVTVVSAELGDVTQLSPAWIRSKLKKDEIVALLKSLLSVGAPLNRNDQTLFDRVSEAIELKPGAFGVKVDLKKLAGKPRRRK